MEIAEKYYIFLTADIHPIGGMQNYTAGKAAWLERQGWQVRIFFGGSSTGECAMPFLNQYVSGGMAELGTPPGEWTKRIRRRTLDKMLSLIGNSDRQGENIIIESQDDVMALWGELLSEELQAKHVCLICNERFRGPGKHYAEYLDFFDFKHKRKELACIHEDSMEKLFDGYKTVEREERYVFCAANEGPVQDVENVRVEQLKVCDWNICCIGRAQKICRSNIIDGICRFARKYPQKSIQLIMVGELGERRIWLEEKLKSSENIDVSCLGDMVPIPRALFEKTDVVIAGSGCATCAAHEKVPTIVVDAGNQMANGILGYTTFSNLFHEDNTEQMGFDTALEQVLIKKIQNNLEFRWPERIPAAHYYERHLLFVEQSDKKREYYSDITKDIKVDHTKVFKYRVRKYFPFVMAGYDRLKGRLHGQR